MLLSYYLSKKVIAFLIQFCYIDMKSVFYDIITYKHRIYNNNK